MKFQSYITDGIDYLWYDIIPILDPGTYAGGWATGEGPKIDEGPSHTHRAMYGDRKSTHNNPSTSTAIIDFLKKFLPYFITEADVESFLKELVILVSPLIIDSLEKKNEKKVAIEIDRLKKDFSIENDRLKKELENQNVKIDSQNVKIDSLEKKNDSLEKKVENQNIEIDNLKKENKKKTNSYRKASVDESQVEIPTGSISNFSDSLMNEKISGGDEQKNTERLDYNNIGSSYSSLPAGNGKFIGEPVQNLEIYSYFSRNNINVVVPLVGIILFLYFKLLKTRNGKGKREKRNNSLKTNRQPTGDIYLELAHSSYKDYGYHFILQDMLCDIFDCNRKELDQKKGVKESDTSKEDFPEGSTILYGLIFDERFEDGAKKQRLEKLKKTKANLVICKFQTGNEYDILRKSLYGEIKTLPFMVNKSNPNERDISLSQNCPNLSGETKQKLQQGYETSLQDLEKMIVM